MPPVVLEATRRTLTAHASAHRVAKRERLRSRRSPQQQHHPTPQPPPGRRETHLPRGRARVSVTDPGRSIPCHGALSGHTEDDTYHRHRLSSLAAIARAAGPCSRCNVTCAGRTLVAHDRRHGFARRAVRRRRHRPAQGRDQSGARARAGIPACPGSGHNEGRPVWAALRIWLVAGEGFEPPTFGL